jgi:hypothetical protein
MTEPLPPGDEFQIADLLSRHFPGLTVGEALPTARAVLKRTAGLLAAHGGTTTVPVIDEHLKWVNWLFPEAVRDIRQHITSLGAKVAALEAEAAALREAVARHETFMKFDHASKGALLKELFALKDEASERGLYALRDAAHKAEGERDEAVARIAELEADVRRLTDERDAFRATLGREATTAKAWRQRWWRAADALADVMPGETGHLDLVSRIHALKTELADETAERKRLSELAQVTTAMGLRRELEEARSELARLKANPPRKLESSGQVAYRMPVDSVAEADMARWIQEQPLRRALKPSGQVAEDIAMLTEALRAATTTEQYEEACLAALSRLAALAQRAQDNADAAEVWARKLGAAEGHKHEWVSSAVGTLVCTGCEQRRYPCSPSCSHVGATKPGHAEQIATLSAEWERLAASPPIAADGHTEVSEPNQAFTEAAKCTAWDWCVHPAGHEGRHESAPIPLDLPARLVLSDDDTSAAKPDAYDRCAEAMRAACCEAALNIAREEGLSPWFLERLKAAIEGAAP